jgi:hypothetical protein
MMMRGREVIETQNNGNNIPRQIASASIGPHNTAMVPFEYDLPPLPQHMAPAPSTSSITNSRRDERTFSNASQQFGRRSNSQSEGAVRCTNRRATRIVANVNRPQQPTRTNTDGRAEIDSRADTLCAGQQFVPISFTGEVVDVFGFHPDMAPIKSLPIATVATAYNHSNGNTYILEAAESLYFGTDMENSLIPPAQLWDNGIQCDITPHQFASGTSIHGIYDPDTDVHLPFQLHGIISYLPIRTPAEAKLESSPRIYLTNDAPWNPYDDRFSQTEVALHTKIAPSLFNSPAPRLVAASSSRTQRSNVDATTLARRWGISHTTAEHTLKATTQRAIRTTTNGITRRFRTRQSQLQYRNLRCPVYTDTLFLTADRSKDEQIKSLRGFTCAQVFSTNKHHLQLYLLRSKAEAPDALNKYCRKIGIPNPIVSDNAPEELGRKWETVRKHFLAVQRTTEPYSGWQNKVELEIRDFKSHFRRIMQRNKAPERLWDFGLQYTADIRARTARHTIDNRTPIETTDGYTPDISEFLDYAFYDWCWAYDEIAKNAELCRWLGVAHNVGAPMVYYVLRPNGRILARSSVTPFTKDDYLRQHNINAMSKYTEQVTNFIGNYDGELILQEPAHDMVEPNNNTATEPPALDVVAGPDELVGAELYLPHGDRTAIAKVLGRKRDADGLFIGRKHSNPILDSRIFTVEFPDGDQQDLAYNVIAEHLFAQCDSEGTQYQVFRGIINHRRIDNKAVDKADQYRVETNGKRVKKKTTAGWDLEVEWRDGSTTWIPLKDIKATNMVEVAEYAVDNRINTEPAFDWWVTDTLRRKKRLIKMSQREAVKTGYKFGIKIPYTVNEALRLDSNNGDTKWYDAIMKEMGNVRVAFRALEPGETVPVGHKRIPIRMIFEIKMDFSRKARLVAGGHLTDPPTSLTYSSVVSWESVRIAFLIAALNDLDVLMSDVGNAYLNAATKEKVYTVAGPEFGDDAGKTMLIVRALYGLKSSGAAWHSHFAQSLRNIGFKLSYADADVWMQEAQKPDGFKYYEYILVYVDDQLTISHNPKAITDLLQTEPFNYKLKDVGPPERYLGAMIGDYDLDGIKTRYMSAELYLERAIPEIEKRFGSLKPLFPKGHLQIPAQTNFHPEMDQTNLLQEDKKTLYQSYIGILRWAVELG